MEVAEEDMGGGGVRISEGHIAQFFDTPKMCIIGLICNGTVTYFGLRVRVYIIMIGFL